MFKLHLYFHNILLLKYIAARKELCVVDSFAYSDINGKQIICSFSAWIRFEVSRNLDTLIIKPRRINFSKESGIRVYIPKFLV